MFSLIGKVFGTASASDETTAKARSPLGEHNTAASSGADLLASDGLKGKASAAQQQPQQQEAQGASDDEAGSDEEYPLYKQGLALLKELRPFLLGNAQGEAGMHVGNQNAPEEAAAAVKKSDAAVELAVAAAKAEITPATLVGQAQRLRRLVCAGQKAAAATATAKARGGRYGVGMGIEVTSPELQAAKGSLRATGRRLTRGPTMEEEAVVAGGKRASVGGKRGSKRKSVDEPPAVVEEEQEEREPTPPKRLGIAPFASPELKAAKGKLRITTTTTTAAAAGGRGRRRSATAEMQEQEEPLKATAGSRRKSGRGASKTPAKKPAKPAGGNKRGTNKIQSTAAMEEDFTFTSPGPVTRRISTRRSTRLGRQSNGEGL